MNYCRRAAPDLGALLRYRLRTGIRGGAALARFRNPRFFAPLCPGVDNFVR